MERLGSERSWSPAAGREELGHVGYAACAAPDRALGTLQKELQAASPQDPAAQEKYKVFNSKRDEYGAKRQTLIAEYNQLLAAQFVEAYGKVCAEAKNQGTLLGYTYVLAHKRSEMKGTEPLAIVEDFLARPVILAPESAEITEQVRVAMKLPDAAPAQSPIPAKPGVQPWAARSCARQTRVDSRLTGRRGAEPEEVTDIRSSPCPHQTPSIGRSIAARFCATGRAAACLRSGLRRLGMRRGCWRASAASASRASTRIGACDGNFRKSLDGASGRLHVRVAVRLRERGTGRMIAWFYLGRPPRPDLPLRTLPGSQMVWMGPGEIGGRPRGTARGIGPRLLAESRGSWWRGSSREWGQRAGACFQPRAHLALSRDGAPTSTGSRSVRSGFHLRGPVWG